MSEEHKPRRRESTPLSMQVSLIGMPLPLSSSGKLVDPYYLVARLEALGKAGYHLKEGLGVLNEEEMNMYYYTVVCPEIIAEARKNGVAVSLDGSVSARILELSPSLAEVIGETAQRPQPLPAREPRGNARVDEDEDTRRYNARKFAQFWLR